MNETTINGWVARDKNGELYVYKNKPKRGHFEWIETSTPWYHKIKLDKSLFTKVKWENDEPTPVTITIKIK